MYADQQREPAFDAVIPVPVRHCVQLSANAKLLYGEIRALAGPCGYCWASNKYLGDLYSLTERSVARIIAQLGELNFVTIQILRDKQGHVSGRRIYIGCGFPELENDTLTHMTKMSDQHDKNVTQGVSGTENDTLSHMTKKSDHMTKMSGQTDKNVSQDINKNNITKKGDACAPAREKTDIQADTRKQLKQWALGLIGEEAEKELIPALMTYCDSRLDRVPPKKPNPLRAGRRTTGFTNKLLQFSKGSLPVMIAIIDKASSHGWDDAWPLKEDELSAVLAHSGTQVDDGSGEDWL